MFSTSLLQLLRLRQIFQEHVLTQFRADIRQSSCWHPGDDGFYVAMHALCTAFNDRDHGQRSQFTTQGLHSLAGHATKEVFQVLPNAAARTEELLRQRMLPAKRMSLKEVYSPSARCAGLALIPRSDSSKQPGQCMPVTYFQSHLCGEHFRGRLPCQATGPTHGASQLRYARYTSKPKHPNKQLLHLRPCPQDMQWDAKRPFSHELSCHFWRQVTKRCNEQGCRISTLLFEKIVEGPAGKLGGASPLEHTTWTSMVVAWAGLAPRRELFNRASNQQYEVEIVPEKTRLHCLVEHRYEVIVWVGNRPACMSCVLLQAP